MSQAELATCPAAETPHPPKTSSVRPDAARPWWGLVLVGWLAMAVFTFHACTRMVAAGDTWVAMACGRHFAQHGVDTVEPFSANSHHAGPTEAEVETWPGWARWVVDRVGLDTVRRWHPTGWVNQNWLTHWIFYQLTTTLGSPEDPYYDALVYWKFSLYALTALCIYALGRLLGVHPVLAAAATCFALFTGRTFLDVRPAGYSNLLVPLTLLVFALSVQRHRAWIWLLVPLTVFWGNVHGGYIYVFIMLVPFIGLHLLTILPQRWSIWLYASAGWAVLYKLCLKLTAHPGLGDAFAPLGGKYIALLLVLSGAGAVLAGRRSVRLGQVLAYHAAASVLVFLAFFFGGMFPTIHYSIVGRALAELQAHLGAARLSYWGLFALFLGLGSLLAFGRGLLRCVRPRVVVHMVGAYGVTLIAAILFNPFHLTNLTHTFIISVSKQAARWRDVHEWHPAFDWTNPVGTAKPFLVMYILAWLALVAWVVCAWITHRFRPTTPSRRAPSPAQSPRTFTWPLLDLPLVTVVALTIYMAIRSRRFIPIAAAAACPLIAMLIQQVMEAVSALVSERRGGRRISPRLSRPLQRRLAGGALVPVLLLGIFWGLKFKRVYLDAWPGDPDYHSVFMRMTASYLKPFSACRFLRENHVAGNMMNYWTEGGAIAFGQEPDPNTGRTPLQLFMDGRAQAAYDVATFNTWTFLWAGGRQGYAIREKGGQATVKDYQAMGRWLDGEMKKRQVWVALLPSKEWTSMFARGLDYAGNWRVVFLNNKQKLYVDRDDPRGRALVAGLYNGSTRFPDDFSRELTLAYHFMRHGADPNERRRGLEHAIAAFKMRPSGVPANMLFDWGTRDAAWRPAVVAVGREYLQDFLDKQDSYRAQHGYRFRLDAAYRTAQYFQGYDAQQGDGTADARYGALLTGFMNEFRDIGLTKRW